MRPAALVARYVYDPYGQTLIEKPVAAGVGGGGVAPLQISSCVASVACLLLGAGVGIEGRAKHSTILTAWTLIEKPSGGGGGGRSGAGGSVTWAMVEQSRFGNPVAWTGQRYDPASRLHHARSYDRRQGRVGPGPRRRGDMLAALSKHAFRRKGHACSGQQACHGELRRRTLSL